MAVSSVARVTEPPKRGLSAIRRREAFAGYLYLLPWLLGFLCFQLGPIIASFGLSFSDFDLVTTPRWVGFQNYVRALTDDRLFWPSLWRTARFSVLVVPLGVGGSLLAALLLNQKLFGKNLFRTLFFLPHLTPIVAAAILWKWIFEPSYGPLNYILSLVGIQGPAWLSMPKWAIPALVIIGLWRGVGGNRMMIFLAGLQGIPKELYEAADIDGANTLHKFWHVTLPMLSPTIFLNLILTIIGSFKSFASAFVATRGGPIYATWFYALHLYHNAFELFELGYASALAWILLLILLVFTYVQLRSSKRWVHYTAEVR